MTIDEYEKLAMRTKGDYANVREQVICAALGISGEGGEVADLVKKVMYQGHKADHDELVHECGDLCWYLALMADAIGVPLESIFESNIEKLKKRYPKGYSHEQSFGRKE